MRNHSATGYESVAGSLHAPPKIAAKIVRNYHLCSITPQIANSNFLSDEDLFCGSKVIYGVEKELDFFGMDTDNNEHPETHSGPVLDSASLTICQSQQFEWKVSNRDKRLMCNNFAQWEEELRRAINKNITKLIDAYSIPKIIASAHPDNVGPNAGRLSHSINLGDQGAGALLIDSPEAFEDLLLSFRQVAQEAGIMCGEGEMPMEGEEASQVVIMIPLHLERFALKLLKESQVGCCDRNGALYTGFLGKIYNFTLISTRWLPLYTVGATPGLLNVVMVDPQQVLHAFDVISNKWYEGKFEDYLVGEFVYDTHVFNNYGVAVATVRLS
jgi:hypothetical protein